MNANDRRTMGIAAAYGYKISEQTWLPPQNLREGDKVIVYTPKGEPVMSGVIDKLQIFDSAGLQGSAIVGGDYYDFAQYRFRYM